MPFVTDFDVTYGNALAPAVRVVQTPAHIPNRVASAKRAFARLAASKSVGVNSFEGSERTTLPIYLRFSQ